MAMKTILTLVAVLMCLSPLSSAVSDQNDECVSKEEFEEIRHEMAVMKQKMAGMEQEMVTTEQKMAGMDRLERENIAVKDEMDSMKQKMAGMERLESENIDVKEEIVSMKQKMTAMEQEIDRLTTADPKHDDDDIQIAFSVVSHVNFGPVESDTNIPFEVIYANVGGGWSSTTNAFHAMTAGFYQFICSIIAPNSENWAVADIVHSYGVNQTKVAAIYTRGEDASNSASNSVILQLDVGDVVSVQLRDGNGWITSSPSLVYSTFTGILVFQ